MTTPLPEIMRTGITGEQWKTARDFWRDSHCDEADDDWEIQPIALLIQRVQIEAVERCRDFSYNSDIDRIIKKLSGDKQP